jgi:hypothetical protein
MKLKKLKPIFLLLLVWKPQIMKISKSLVEHAAHFEGILVSQ